MSTYQIRMATWNDIHHLQNLSANSSLGSPLTNAILTDPKANRINNAESRIALAYFIYKQALRAQDIVNSDTKVLKAVNTQDPNSSIQASAWLEWFKPDPSYEGLRNNFLGDGQKTPPLVNSKAYQLVELTKHSHRKGLMKGKGHYFIRSLDMESNAGGKAAARELLCRIHNMDPENDIIAQTKAEHVALYRGLGWQDMGDVVFMLGTASVHAPYKLRVYLRPGIRMTEIKADSPSGQISRKEGKRPARR